MPDISLYFDNLLVYLDITGEQIYSIYIKILIKCVSGPDFLRGAVVRFLFSTLKWQ